MKGFGIVLVLIAGGFGLNYLNRQKKKNERIAYLRSAMATAQEDGDNAKYVKLQEEYIRLTA